MKEEILKRWIDKAEDDLLMIENEMEFVPRERWATSSICFHAQQFVEKYLKAYLSLKNIRVSKTHDIGFLIEQCIKTDKEFENLKSISVEKLTIYAVEVRYPDDFYTPTFEETEEAYKIALSVRDFVRAKLGLKDSKDEEQK